MTTMMEKVARIIDPAAFEAGHREGECQDCDNARDEARDRARAILEVLRVPADDMLAAKDNRGDPVLWDCNCNMCGGPKENWNIMIDAALKEGPDAG